MAFFETVFWGLILPFLETGDKISFAPWFPICALHTQAFTKVKKQGMDFAIETRASGNKKP